MLNLSRFRQQKVEILKKNQPGLYDTLTHVFPTATEEQLGKMAGLHMEYVIQSGGNVEIFGTFSDIEEASDF